MAAKTVTTQLRGYCCTHDPAVFSPDNVLGTYLYKGLTRLLHGESAKAEGTRHGLQRIWLTTMSQACEFDDEIGTNRLPSVAMPCLLCLPNVLGKVVGNGRGCLSRSQEEIVIRLVLLPSQFCKDTGTQLFCLGRG